MYRVRFARKVSESSIDLGDVILNADSRDDAIVRVAGAFDLPITATQFDVNRLKPGLFQVGRRTVDGVLSTINADVIPAGFAAGGTFPARLVDRVWFTLMATAEIKADDQTAAMRGLGVALLREAANQEQRHSVRNLEITVDRAALHPRTADVDRNALYTDRRIFEGGAARPR